MGRSFKQIDIYLKLSYGGLEYLASTSANRTCREAKEQFAQEYLNKRYAASDLLARRVRVSPKGEVL